MYYKKNKRMKLKTFEKIFIKTDYICQKNLNFNNQ